MKNKNTLPTHIQAELSFITVSITPSNIDLISEILEDNNEIIFFGSGILCKINDVDSIKNLLQMEGVL